MKSRKLTSAERKKYIKSRLKKRAEVTFLNKNLTLKDLKELKKLDKDSKLKSKLRKLFF